MFTAIAYDWLHGHLTETQRRDLIEWLVSAIGEPRLDDEISEYRGVRTPRCLYPALAFHGDGVADE